LSLRLFGAAGFRGLGYLEVKRDVRTGAHYAIEANVGRPTGRSAIAEIAGVELLFAMYCDLLDLPMPTARQSYGQAKWIFLRQDVRSALYDWKQGKLSLTDWARSLRGARNDAVLAWSDPGPFVADMFNLLTERGRPKLAAVNTIASAASESPEGVVP
jgi:predicted ATP-grasp superfamily ATP-dependent carboligase